MIKLRTVRHFLATLIFAINLGVVGTAQAVECKVNAFDAYIQSVKKGWSFYCTYTTGTSAVFLPLPPDGLGCVGSTGLFGSGQFGATFFQHRSISDVTGENKWRKLNNGWTFKDYDVVGGQHTRFYDLRNALTKFRAQMEANRKFKYIVKNLVISKDGGQCRNALNEAF